MRGPAPARPRHRPRRWWPLLGAALAAALGAPGRAGADERELTLALQPGFAVAKVGDRTAWGGGGGLDLQYGVTDALSVRVTGAYSLHALPAGDKNSPPGGQLAAWHAGAGISYAVDIVRLVPYFDLSLGLLGMSYPTDKGPRTINDVGVEIGLGADYLLTRLLSIGFVVRYHAYLTNLSDIPVYLYAGPRLAFRFQL